MADDHDLVAGELTIGGRARGFALGLPRRAGGGIPLVLVLHGNHPDANGGLMRQWTTFDEQAEASGFAVAYPDGHGGCWADGRGVTTADEAGVDDVAFLRALIDWSAARHGTVSDRAVVAGMSNGAFMAHRMALEASDQVAVLAAVAGRSSHPRLPAGCDPRPPGAVTRPAPCHPPGPLSRVPHHSYPPRHHHPPLRFGAGPGAAPAGNDIDAPSMSRQQHRCSIHVVCPTLQGGAAGGTAVAAYH